MKNHAWRLNDKYGVAYTENRKTVDDVLVVLGRYSTTGRWIMSTYMTQNGKAFAWQVLFEMEKWKQISKAMKITSYELLPGDEEEKPVKVSVKTKAKAKILSTPTRKRCLTVK